MHSHTQPQSKPPALPVTDFQVEQSLEFLWLEITPKCNLNCTHCYAESTPYNSLRGQMATDDWLSVIQQAFDAGCRRVQFIGGEPTLNPDLFPMISFARNIGYEFVEVYTNGTTLSDHTLDNFKGHGVNLAISLYSFNPRSHDKITLKRGSHVKTVDAIDRALTVGLPLRVGIIEMDENSGEIEETVTFLERLGVQDIRVDRKRQVGRGASGTVTGDKISELCGHCWEGKLAVNADGYAFPCVFSSFHNVGHIREGMAEILSKETLRGFRALVHQSSLERKQKMTCSPYDDDACQPDDQKSCGPYTGCNPDYCTPTQRHCNPDNCTPSK